MKSTILSALAMMFAMFVTSCNRENVLTANESTDFEEVVQLSAARVSATSDSITKQKCKGNLTPIDAAALPASVKTYISTKYAGAEVHFAGKDSEGKIVVGLKLADGTHKGLLFNADGTFNKELAKYDRGAKLTPVAASALPAAITAYIAKNYAGLTVKKAGTNADGAYYVALTNADGSVKKVAQFDAKGVFVQEMTPPAHPEGPKDKDGKRAGKIGK